MGLDYAVCPFRQQSAKTTINMTCNANFKVCAVLIHSSAAHCCTDIDVFADCVFGKAFWSIDFTVVCKKFFQAAYAAVMVYMSMGVDNGIDVVGV
jgi:hypothetical protein